jgi:hypothetical protein
LPELIAALSKHSLWGMHHKPRERRTSAKMAVIRAAIIDLLIDDHPMAVRQVFYRLVVAGIIEKTEQEYQRTVIRLLTRMRLDGEVPFEWIVDEGRRARQNYTFNNVLDALRDCARTYRRSALRECPDYIEIWCEKEALAGFIWDVAGEYDVPVMVSKGMPSLTQLYSTYVNIRNAAFARLPGKKSYIYQFGDHDPSGVLIPQVIERRLREFCEKEDCPVPHVERIALTKAQINEFNLPTRPTKRVGNPHAPGFRGRSTELDALPPDVLRDLVRSVIERHINSAALQILRTAEESERELIQIWANGFEAAQEIPDPNPGN